MILYKSEDELIHKFLDNKDDLDVALNVVKDYIIDNKLIITGGFALDLAFKTKNSFIYDSFTIPDYDVITDDNIKHCNNLGMILCNLNKFDVDIINAIHNTTMRIKVLGYTVFDCTYVPTLYLEKIPFINCNGFKIINPCYQMIDQFLSLSYLFNSTGPEYNYVARLKKDYNRNKLIQFYFDPKFKPSCKISEYSNISMKHFKNCKIYSDTINTTLYDYKLESIEKKTNNIWFFTDSNYCCGPILSAILLCFPDHIKIEDDMLFAKSNLPLDLMYNKNNNDIEYQNKKLDIIPPSALINDSENKDETIMVYNIENKRMTLDIIPFKGFNFLICSPCYILSFLLFYCYQSSDDFYKFLYNEVIKKYYISISSFETHNLNDEEIWFIKNLKNSNDPELYKPVKNYLKKSECKMKSSIRTISELKVYNIGGKSFN